MAFSAVDTVVGWLEKVDQNAADKAAAGEGAISLLASGVLVDASMEHAQPDSLAGTTTREPPRTKGATSTPKQEQAAAFRVPTVAQLAPATKRILRGTGADLVCGTAQLPCLRSLTPGLWGRMVGVCAGWSDWRAITEEATGGHGSFG
mmetsp:Transcript_731/g.2760  ORF Transcript_731/g.2760 Transcript_731/m.2760 type:complete len:148 (-) Transcript_731:1745-2188(-)